MSPPEAVPTFGAAAEVSAAGSEGGVGKGTWAAVAVGLLCGTGCFSPSPEALARVEQAKAEGDELALAVDSLEERFLGNQANLMLWEELKRRHGQVSEIACANHTAHFNEMAKKFEQNEQKMRQARRRRVADASKGSTTVVSTASHGRSSKRNN